MGQSGVSGTPCKLTIAVRTAPWGRAGQFYADVRDLGTGCIAAVASAQVLCTGPRWLMSTAPSVAGRHIASSKARCIVAGAAARHNKQSGGHHSKQSGTCREESS